MPPVKKTAAKTATTTENRATTSAEQKTTTTPKKDNNVSDTATKTPAALLKSQRAHADKYKGQTESQGGRDYPATDVEREAGTIRLPHYEALIADAANQADQDAIDDLTEQYHEARLKLAQKRAEKREG